MSLSYMLTTLVTPYLLPNYVEKRVTMIMSLILLGLASFLCGPFYTELSFPVMLTGLLLQGAFMGPLVILNMAEMMAATEVAFPEADEEQASHLLSGMLCSSYGLGQALGPILGSALYQMFGWRIMCDSIGGFCLVFAFLYIVCAKGCDAFGLTCMRCCRKRGQSQASSEQVSNKVTGSRPLSKQMTSSMGSRRSSVSTTTFIPGRNARALNKLALSRSQRSESFADLRNRH